MNKLKLLTILFIIFILGIAATVVFYSFYYVYDIQHIPVSYEVSDAAAGVLLENKSLAMGRVSPGGSSAKEFSISTPIATRFHVQVNRDLASTIYFTPVEGDLQPNEPVTVKVKLVAPEDEPLGVYTGTVTVQLFRR